MTLPFVFLPATAGVAAFAGMGGLSVGLGALRAGAGRYVAPRVAGWWKGGGSAEPTYEFIMIESPGPLASLRNNPAAKFAGGK